MCICSRMQWNMCMGISIAIIRFFLFVVWWCHNIFSPTSQEIFYLALALWKSWEQQSINRSLQEQRREVTKESFSWKRCLPTEKQVISQERWIHQHLVRWQWVPTACLAAASTNGHQPSEIWESIDAFFQVITRVLLLLKPWLISGWLFCRCFIS